MKKSKDLLSAVILAALYAIATLASENVATQSARPPEAAPDTWSTTDALGRAIPTAQEAGPPRPGRFVGIFYFLTHAPGGNPPNDLAKILAKDPDILNKPNSPLWGAPGPYYWGEPLYGYYQSTDPWVLRRHANLLADAGIDTLIFDTTNRITYRNVYMKICEVWTQIRKEGGHTPQICFMVNTLAGETAQEIYRDLYKPGLYKDLWFRWQGKPLMICDPKEANDELRAFFTLRKAHWPFTLVNTHNEWHWESTYPQVYSYDQDPSKPEEVNVAVAQNLRASDGVVTNMSEGNARGRSFHDGGKDSSPGAVNQGYNFQEQWRRALELDPPFVMVTGWNEWTAGKFVHPDRPVTFVDQFDQEYSRDIEPVTGLHNDNYYCQLIANVRRYKGVASPPKASAPKAIDVEGGFGQWQDVGPEFVDHAFDNDHRDCGVGAVHYVNTSGRNDVTVMKVARDSKNVYFYAKTREATTSCQDPNWMWLLIDVDQDPKTGWQGYDFIVNRTLDGSNSTWLEKNAGGWKWQKIAPVRLRVNGCELQLAIPRAALGLVEGRPSLSLDFKWVDNIQHPGDIMDFYHSGDVAPEGRFNYRYTAADRQPAVTNANTPEKKTPEVWMAVLPADVLVEPGANWDFVKRHVDGIKFWTQQIDDEAKSWPFQGKVDAPDALRKLIAELKQSHIPMIIEKGCWPQPAPHRYYDRMGGKGGPYDDTFSRRAVANELERIRRVESLGGAVAAFDVDGPIHHMLRPITGGEGFATIERCAQEFTKYMMGVHAARPEIGFYALTNFPNWGYRGEAAYWGAKGWGDYFTAVEAVIRNAKASGAPLRGITVDNPFDYATGQRPLPPARKKRAGYDPKKIDWMARILDLERYVHAQGLQFNLIINSEGAGNASNRQFNSETLEFLDLYQKRGGRPDRYIVQSWYPHPLRTEVLPDTSPDTFTGLVKEVIQRVKGIH